jgi:1-deoxy-D-xylulose-5-phosphate reductoisomerase
MKNILVLGSTGSIGMNTLELVRSFPDQFRITGLTVNCKTELLEHQIEEFHPQTVVVRDRTKAAAFKQKIGNKCEVLSGDEGLLEISSRGNYDVLLSAIVGFAGLAPTINAIKQKKRIALANKETLVVAGEIIIKLCKHYGAELLPVDSEHSAIFQCLNGENKEDIHKLILDRKSVV